MSVQLFLSKVASLDVAAFYFINHMLYDRRLADAMYFFAQDRLILLVLIFASIGYLFWTGWRKALMLAGWGAGAIVLSNLMHNQVLKLFFNRQRPFLTLPDVHLCVPLGDLYSVSLSFPSTHAASAMALAVVAMGLDSRLRVWALLFAFFIGFGTIYSGGHYPADVVAGFSVGAVLGWVLIKLRHMVWPRETRGHC